MKLSRYCLKNLKKNKMRKKIVICLSPEDKLRSSIADIKKIAYTLVGEQQYLLDDPHTTIFVGIFNYELLKADVANIAKKIAKTDINIVGWHIFHSDPITEKSTLVCSFNKESVDKLREIQDMIIKR